MARIPFDDYVYAGIGSRETPAIIQFLEFLIAYRRASKGVKLRSGGADGSDTAFYLGCLKWCLEQHTFPVPAAEIWVREKDLWKAKKTHREEHLYVFERTDNIEAANILASEIHPNWPAVLKLGVEHLHSRNCYQILGQSLASPVNQTVLWAPPAGESIKGGTRTAFELAKKHNIDIINLYFHDAQQRAFKFLGITEVQFLDLYYQSEFCND